MLNNARVISVMSVINTIISGGIRDPFMTLEIKQRRESFHHGGKMSAFHSS